MRVLLADVPDPLREPLRAALGERHQVDEFRGDVRDATACTARAACDVVVHADPGDDVDASARIERATLGTWNILTTTAATRYVRLSTMRILDSYDAGWEVTEAWSSRPTAAPLDLAAHLAELTSREVTRSRTVEADVLRLDDVVDAATFDAGPVAPTWLHVDDAVRAIVRTVELEPTPSAPRWRAWHIVRGTGRYPLAAARCAPLDLEPVHTGPPAHGPTVRPAPAWPRPPAALTSLPRPERITLLGGGGPLGVATHAALSGDHVLRVTDARPLAELATRPPQSPGAPVPAAVAPPHEERVVDITDADAVRAAALGADCLINCAVVRTDPVGAFRVNVLGAFHTMQAAVGSGIARVVHTGPTLARERPLHPFAVSWADAGRAMAAATHVEHLPEPSPVLHVLAPSPHGRYPSDAIRDVLGWEATDRLDTFWHRR